MTVLDRAIERLGQEAADASGDGHFDELRPYLTSRELELPHRELAAKLKVSESAVRVAVHRLRRHYGNCIRAEIADTVADPAEIDDEVRHLLKSLRPKPATGM